MLLHAYSLYDRKVETYNAPFFAHHDGHAMRSLQTLVSDTTTVPGTYPQDFVLYRIGSFDDATGQLLPTTPAIHIADASSVAPPKLDPDARSNNSRNPTNGVTR